MYTLFMCRLCARDVWIADSEILSHNCSGAYNPACEHHPEDDETGDIFLRFQRQPDGRVSCLGRSIYGVRCACDAGEEMHIIRVEEEDY